MGEVGLDVETTVSQGLATTMRPLTEGGEPEVVDVDSRAADLVGLQLPKTKARLQIPRILQSRGVAVAGEADDLLSAVASGSHGYDALVRRAWRSGRRPAPARPTSSPPRPPSCSPSTRPPAAARWSRTRSRGGWPSRPAYEHTPDVVTVGWAGNLLGHPYDLQEMGSGLQTALGRTQGASRFLVLGRKWDAKERMCMPEEPGEVPWIQDVDGYTAALVELFDVGVAPLRIDKFNECKSWLEPLGYAARGVYCVRARTSEYERIGWACRPRRPRAGPSGSRSGSRTATAAWRAALDNRAHARRTGAPAGAAPDLAAVR